jgi:mannose-6-phosphate isomerase
LLEIQEPTDYTIRTEKVTPSGLKVPNNLIHQGIGFIKMFDCFDFSGYSIDNVLNKWRIKPKVILENDMFEKMSLISYEDTQCFKLVRFRIYKSTEIDVTGDTFSVIVVLNGSGILRCDESNIKINRGDRLFVPAGIDSIIVSNISSSGLLFVQYFPPK